MRRVLIIAAMLLPLVSSCRMAAGPVLLSGAQSARDTLTLRVGETVVWNGIDLGFSRVVEDNRCPIDVRCIWAGNAAVEIGVGPPHGTRGPTHALILNTSLEPRAGEALGVRVELLELRPQPVSTEPIPPDAYVVTLAAARAPR